IHESKLCKASRGLALHSGLGRFLCRHSCAHKLGGGPRRKVFLQIPCRCCPRTGPLCVSPGAKEDARGPWLVAASVFRVCAGACARTHWLRFSRESILRDTLLSVSSVSAGAPPSFDHIPKNKQASTFR